jgi:hypothetical protein
MGAPGGGAYPASCAAGIDQRPAFDGVSVRTLSVGSDAESGLGPRKGFFEALFALQGVLPAVARFCEPLRCIRDREV